MIMLTAQGAKPKRSVPMKVRKGWVTECGFRLVSAFSIEHNAMRFKTHMNKQRKLKRDPGAMRFRLKVLRQRLVRAGGGCPAPGTTTRGRTWRQDISQAQSIATDGRTARTTAVAAGELV